MTTTPGPPVTRAGFLAATAALVLAACGNDGGGRSSTPPDPAPARTVGESASTGPTTAITDVPPASVMAEGAAPSTATDETAAATPSVIPAAMVGATTIDGAAFDADALAGRPTVAWFWAPWCVICRGEAPDVVDVVSRYSDRVNVVGVAGRGEAAEMREFVADTDTSSFIHLDDSSGEIWASYEIFAQPAFAFLTDDGRLGTFTGSLGADELAAIVDQLLDA